MKNTVAVLALSSFFIFSACKKTETQNTTIETSEPKAEQFVVDSVSINDSIKISDSLQLKFSSKMLVFPSIKDKNLLDSIYMKKNMSDFSKTGVQNLLQAEKNGYFESVRKDSKDFLSDITFAEVWYEDNKMKLVSHANDYLHIRYYGGSYSGGAHDNYAYMERVFDLKNSKKLELKDITSMPLAKIEELLKKNINKINSGTTDEKGEVNNSDMLLVDKIPATGNFYFDEKNLYFHYSPYEIAAFAAGDIEIPISWEELKGTLNAGFKERMKIK
ncbi:MULTISPECIES: RsiV family protein [unclassified Chryseobacterium]|uniref:RsiV family protein n=1 Tax=unclassified Chryseobacterium TaxID=2593645 RepID=UPI00226A54DF|nr:MULTISPECIES: RsiV family protein [unclassified Chryseobacterium]